MMRLAITIFEARPKPNQITSSGAMANTGSACATSSTGLSARRAVGEAAIKSAQPMPSAAPQSSPSSISPSVIAAFSASIVRLSHSAAPMRMGPGRI